MNINEEILQRLKTLELRLDKIEAYLSDFQPFDFPDNPDILYSRAVDLVRQHEMASASLLQRRLSIGYARAARILDQLTDRGVIGSGNGSTPRKVLEQKET